MTYIKVLECGGFVEEAESGVFVVCENPEHEEQITVSGDTISDLEIQLRSHARDFVGLDDELQNTATDLKIFRYAAGEPREKKDPPWGLDYITGLTRRLYRDERFVHGELREIYYCANVVIGPDGWPTYNDVIVSEHVTYQRDSVGFARSRLTEIRWYKEDGTVHPDVKQLHKTYSAMESQKEGIARRSNIIDDISVKTVGMILATVPTNDTYPTAQSKIDLGREFMGENKTVMDMFIMAGERDIVAAVKYAPNWWLNNPINAQGTTIRQYLLSQVDIWGIAGTV